MRQSWEQTKGELVHYAHVAYDRGLAAGTGGNISVHTGDGSMLITAAGVSLAEASPQNLIIVSLDTLEWQAGQGLLPSRDYVYHAQILRLRKDVGCVIHVHPPYASTFAALQRDIPIRSAAGYQLPQIARVPIDAPGLARLHEEIIGYVRSYPAAKAFLVQGHGLTTVGPTIRTAFELADLIESAARVSFQVELLSKLDKCP